MISQRKSTPLPKFSGHKKDYRAWNNMAYEKALTASYEDPQGLGILWFFGTDAAYLAADRAHGIVAGPFVPRPHPGARPATPVFANELELHTFNRTIADFERIENSHNNESRAVDEFRREFIENIPSLTLIEVKDPVHEYRRLTLREVHAFMDRKFLTLSPSDLSANLNQILIPYNFSNSAIDYTNLHREIHAVQVENNNPIPEFQKVKHFLQGLAPCGIFLNAIDIWQAADHTVAGQTFNGLATAITNFYRNLPSTMTSGSGGYTAAATPAPPAAALSGPPTAASAPPPTLESMAASLATMGAAMAAMQSFQQSQGQSKGGGTKRGGGGGGTKKTKYCWTHGRCKHASPMCNTQLPGHQVAATFANQMGGTSA